MGNKLRFSGHESFQCRHLWPKKGYDFITLEEGNFNDSLAVVKLGVGKNMVDSIRFWMRSFNLLDNNEQSPTPLADLLFSNNGKDPFVEDIGTLWLLHYYLVKNSSSFNNSTGSINHFVFNRFRKQRIEFTREHLINFLISLCDQFGETHSENTIETDVGVFLKNYVRPNKDEGRKSLEDQFSSLFIELNLVKRFENRGASQNEWYKIESSERENLPLEIFFYTILDNFPDSNSISLQKLLNDNNSPGNIYVLHPDALVSKVKQLTKRYEGIVYTEDAGIREVQLNRNFNKEEILNEYYGGS